RGRSSCLPLITQRGSLMPRRIYLFVVVLGTLLWPAGASAQGLTPEERGRLDARLQVLVDRAGAVAPARVGGRPPVAMRVAGGGRPAAPVYGAVVHTDDPAGLRALGVQVNAVFDGLASVRVTTDDLRRLARHG